MKRVNIISAIIILVMTGCGGIRQTSKQISKKKYQEVIGDRTNLMDAIVPDKYAMYPDGIEGVQKHILKNMKYPPNAVSRGVQGRVILGFVVEKNGKVNEIWVEQSIDPELDEEAIRVLRSLETWVPGYVNGKPARVKYLFPFSFRL
jgi:TonB family protein